MNDTDLNNFFKPAKELIKRLPKNPNSTMNINSSKELELKKSLIHPTILKNANREQKIRLNKSIEDISKQIDKMTVKVPTKNVFDREYLFHENENLKKLISKKNFLIDELRFTTLKMGERNEKNLKNFEEILERTVKFNAQSNPDFYKKPRTSHGKSSEDNLDNNAPVLTDNNAYENTQYQTSPNQENKEKETNDQLTKSINFEDSKGDLDDIPKKEQFEISIRQVKEMTLITGLRRQIMDFKGQIKKRDEEIERLKNSTKCVRLTELENNYIKQLEENTLLQQQFDILTKVLEEKDSRLRTLEDEHFHNKSQLNLYKARHDDNTETNTRLKNENQYLKDRVRDLEDKNKTAEYKLHFTKQLVKEREKELENLAKEKENYEQGKAEKLKQEKKIEDLNGKVNTYKQDIKSKANKISELEKKITLLQDEFANSIKNLNKKLKHSEATISSYKEEKEVFNKKLDEEKNKNNKSCDDLKDEIKVLKESLESEENKSGSLSEKIDTLEKEISSQKKEIQTLKDQNIKLASERDNLLKQKEDFNQSNESAEKEKNENPQQETK